MEWLRFWERGRKDAELERELAFYLEEETRTNIGAGMDLDAARAAAVRKLGNATQVRETVYDRHSVPILDPLWRDVRYGFRQLRRAPALTCAAVLSLALGIGANTAMFQLLNALSLRTLPVVHPEELVEIRLSGDGHGGRHTGRNRQLSWPQWNAIRDRQQAFATMLAFGDTRFNLSPQGEVRYVEGLWVSGSFFDALGVKPVLGRLFTVEDDTPGCLPSAAVISHAFWQRELGGRPDVIGHTIETGVSRVAIVGVTPPEFFGVEVGRQFEIALPLCAAGFDRRDHWWLAVIGRLAPGWTIEAARAHLQGLIGDVQAETLPTNYQPDFAEKYLAMRADVRDARAGVSPLRALFGQPLSILMAISGLVVLIATVNLANLLLARATARQQEFAVRLAIGGSRRRLVQQLLTESAIVAALGASAALAVAWFLSRSIVALISTPTDRIVLDLGLDWRVFGFIAVVATSAALIFGMAPSIRAIRSQAMITSERGATASRSTLWARQGLIGLQVAITFVLLFSALLFLRSFWNLTSADTGVRANGVVIANLFLRDREYPPPRREVIYTQIQHRLQAIPGMTAVASAFVPPLGGTFWDSIIKIDGVPRGVSNVNRITPAYFEVMGTSFVAGRDFDERDTPGSPKVAIVNEAFAAKFLDGPPLGMTVTVPGSPDTTLTIVGVVKNQKYSSVREEFPPCLFQAYSQDTAPGLTRRYVVKTSLERSQATMAVKKALEEIDPAISIRFATLESQIAESLLLDRLMARLSGLFGIIALALAIVGLYGVVAYTVTTRRKEIGVRMALGAGRRRILSMILSQVGRTLGAGMLFGGVLAYVSSQGLTALLYRLQPRDVATLFLAAAILAFAGLLAAMLPARAAATIDPAQTLRE